MRSLVVFVVAAVGCGKQFVPESPDGGSGSGSGSGSGVIPSGTCPLYQVPTTTNLTTPSASFATDVMPILHTYCTSAACHGASSNPSGGLYLASAADSSYTHLVGVASVLLPAMKLVAPGDPENSFLMHKLDADQCAYDHDCTGGSCGTLMPRGNPSAMPVGNRDTIRRWIAQGAHQ
jgi:hypothetical protein